MIDVAKSWQHKWLIVNEILHVVASEPANMDG